ncbi:fatty acid desaturase [Micromonospora costi]|uniref:fatty acid desaturase n=1 Tax=Micromonospora costi TaxID=1530042 RepID=UPI001F4E0EFB|nr:fatty acid desaturase [Micromonospora costi]
MSSRASAAARGSDHTVTSVVLVATALGVLCLQLVVLPLWLLPSNPTWGWLLAPLALLTTPYWSLLHDAIHGTLLARRTWNDRCGRALAVGYGAPFALLKTGHLLHHRYSRTRRERTEVYDPATTRWAAVAPGYYLRLVGGLYLAEVATVLLAAAPARAWRHLARRLDSPDTVTGLLLDGVRRRHLRQFRVDGLAVVLVHGAAGVAYGRHVWMLGAALAARAVLISVADNAYHYGTRLEASLEAMNLRLPRALETFVLAFNLHGVHHRHPGLPWHELRRAFTADADRFHLGWFDAVGRQVRGPIPATAPEVEPAATRVAPADPSRR